MSSDWIDEARHYLGPDHVVEQPALAILERLEAGEGYGNDIFATVTTAPTSGESASFESNLGGCSVNSGAPGCVDCC
jgi:hypothetical protein